jgi:hypothetical protein
MICWSAIYSAKNGVCVRGHVASFDSANGRWRLEYSDGSFECVDIDVLNQRLQRRYNYDHGETGLGEGGARRVGFKSSGAAARQKELEALLAGVDQNWSWSKWARFVYDHWHFMKNWRLMLAVDKHSEIAKVGDL